MEITYPAGPAAIPANLIESPRALRRQARLALAALAGFFLLYFALAGWLAWSAIHLFAASLQPGEPVVLPLLGSLLAALLAVFALKPLFFIARSAARRGVEITAEEQPRLFRFLYRLADEARAPRPRRVFVSARVVAAISHDVTVANLFMRPALYMEVGLALVDALSLGEFKAVVAHEMGRFSRRMPASARWVALAWHVAAHLLGWRDRLDELLHRLAHSDIRIAWIGWALTLIVTSVRSLLEVAFRDLIDAQRSVARHIEARADLLAVSLAGSDALVHALYRLQAADDAWERTLAFVEGEKREGRAVRDIIAVQARITEQLRVVLAKPDFAAAPPVPRMQPQAHRVFTAEQARPPRMWSTHRSNFEREQNAKRVYVPVPPDSQQVWELFEDAASLRERVSAHAADVTSTAAPIEESLRRVNDEYERPYLNRAFRGAYLNRSPVRHAARAADLYDALPEGPVTKALLALYPESIGAELEGLRTLERELASLRALQDTHAPYGPIRHRGKELQPDEVPHALSQVREEIAAVSRSLADHDRRCRAAHLAAAAALKGGWEEYLRGLARVLHYADHADANVRDAHGTFADVVTRVTSGGRMNESQLQQLLQAAGDLDDALRGIHDDAKELVLDRTVARRLHAPSWRELLGEYSLAGPTEETINAWMRAITGCVTHATARLGLLRLAALEQLLLSETQVARFARQSMTPGAAPPASRVPVTYPVLLPGQERPRPPLRRGWEKFQESDRAVATVARVVVAAGLIGSILAISAGLGGMTVTIYNGLARELRVNFDRDIVAVKPQSTTHVRASSGEMDVAARTLGGRLVEEFTANLEPGKGRYVYNVAGASPLLEWTALYGKASGDAERELGAPHWVTTNADVLFEEPPAMLQTESGGAARRVLSGMADGRPEQLLSAVATDAEQSLLISTHARWDDSNSKHTGFWLLLASERSGFPAIIAHRLAENPTDTLTLRMEQDTALTAESLARVCQRHTALAAAAPTNPDLQYLAARCLPDEQEKKSRFLVHHRTWPENGWLAYAAGYTLAEDGKWQEAMSLLEQARYQVPAFSDYLAVDIARIRRLLAAGPGAQLADLERDSALVAFLDAAETGRGLEDSPLLAYRELAQGKLAEAVEKSAAVPDAQSRVIRLAAASDGASPALVERALALPMTQGLDRDTIWAAIGLAARQKASLDPYYEMAASMVRQDAPAMRAFLDAVRDGANPLAADASLVGVHMKSRAQAYGAALVLLGKNAPAQWRDRVKLLLFAYERPWFE